MKRERRFLVASMPDGVVGVRRITDRYLDATRLPLREVVETDGSAIRKLGQKLRLTPVIREVTAEERWTGGGLAG